MYKMMDLKEALINKDLKNLKKYFKLKWIAVTDWDELEVEKIIKAFNFWDSSRFDDEFQEISHYDKYFQKIKIPYNDFDIYWIRPINSLSWEKIKIYENKEKIKETINIRGITSPENLAELNQKALEEVRNEIRNRERTGLFSRFLIRY